MDFPYVTDGAVPDQLASLADEIAGVTLIAHLRGHTGFLRDARDLPRLPDVVRERLLAIDMLLQSHRTNAHVGVQMIGRRTENRIHGFLLLQQDAEIFVSCDGVVGCFRSEILFNLGFHRQASGRAFVIKGIKIL